MVDIEKFICSLIHRSSGFCVIKVIDIIDALHYQGLDYKDGRIVRVTPESEESDDERMLRALREGFNILNKDDEWYGGITSGQIFAWLKKKGEQKPADKVEPKFHEGDWVVSPNGVYWHVDAIRDGRYQVSSNSGECTDWSLNTNIYHKFTIQDAKDGDVLYCKSGGIEYIVMSKGVNEHGNIDSYFRYNSFDGFGVDVPSVLSSRQDDITPATKEQRDTLFAKMHEAGYEWDAEKKELMKEVDNLHNYLYGEPSLAWSEEDERILIEMLTIFGLEKFEGYNIGENNKDALKFLNSIKDRVQPQPKEEWGEEDESWFKEIELMCLNFSNDTDYREKFSTWFKSLKNRVGCETNCTTTWKPSDMQIGLLQAIVNEPNNAASESCQIALKEVIRQLKKLKGDEHANE